MKEKKISSLNKNTMEKGNDEGKKKKFQLEFQKMTKINTRMKKRQ